MQKQHFQAAGIPLADFAEVADAAAGGAAGADYGFPFMLKSRRCVVWYPTHLGGSWLCTQP